MEIQKRVAAVMEVRQEQGHHTKPWGVSLSGGIILVVLADSSGIIRFSVVAYLHVVNSQ